MVTVIYCRVSTIEQAEEGFSIDGQADKLRAYARLHELGEIEVISDPGRSGKDLDRPGLQRVLAMVEAGQVSHVLIWRLDRLSRDVGDLAFLSKTLNAADVTLHSFTESLDMSSATGRMFFNILASFAQFYREQLAENVRMGLAQAIHQGRWVNRAPTGYTLTDGTLVANDDAATVRRIFRLRARDTSLAAIAEQTGITYSTVGKILRNRAYLGEVYHNGEWLPARHEPLVTEAEFAAVQRGRVPGRRRGRDLMSGRVCCGLCGRRMSVEQNGQGQAHYRCKHRGQGCKIAGRSNRGLLEAAVLALELLCDEGLREAIRKHLDTVRRSGRQAARRTASGTPARLRKLRAQRSKLLDLHYADKISADQFGEEQARLTIEIESLEEEERLSVSEQLRCDEVADKFDQLAKLLDTVNIRQLWNAATDTEKRTLLDELVRAVTVHPDRLVVEVHGAPPLNVAFAEVGLRDSENTHVGGPT